MNTHLSYVNMKTGWTSDHTLLYLSVGISTSSKTMSRVCCGWFKTGSWVHSLVWVVVSGSAGFPVMFGSLWFSVFGVNPSVSVSERTPLLSKSPLIGFRSIKTPLNQDWPRWINVVQLFRIWTETENSQNLVWPFNPAVPLTFWSKS